MAIQVEQVAAARVESEAMHKLEVSHSGAVTVVPAGPAASVGRCVSMLAEAEAAHNRELPEAVAAVE